MTPRPSATLLVFVCTTACSHDPQPQPLPEPDAATATSAGGSARPIPSSAPTVPASAYGPAVLHPRTCPSGAPAPRPAVESGCEACKPGEFCETFGVRGRTLGRCAKSDCQRDADCGGALCACGPPNHCVAGNCRGPEDCGGRECVADRWRYGHGRGTWCRTAADTCTTHDDCGTGQECAWLADKWGCRPEVPAPPPG